MRLSFCFFPRRLFASAINLSGDASQSFEIIGREFGGISQIRHQRIGRTAQNRFDEPADKGAKTANEAVTTAETAKAARTIAMVATMRGIAT